MHLVKSLVEGQQLAVYHFGRSCLHAVFADVALPILVAQFLVNLAGHRMVQVIELGLVCISHIIRWIH